MDNWNSQDIDLGGKRQYVSVLFSGIREGCSPIGKPLTEKQRKIVEHYNKGREYYKQPVAQKLEEDEVKKILKKVEEMPNAKDEELSYKVEEQLKYELKQLLHQVKKLSEYDRKNLCEADKLLVLLEPEIKLLNLAGIKNLSEEEATLLVKAKVQQLSAADLKELQEGEFKKILEAGINDPSNSQIQRLKAGQIKQLLEAKIKSRVPESATEMLEEEFPNQGGSRKNEERKRMQV
jgi:adenylate cyclase